MIVAAIPINSAPTVVATTIRHRSKMPATHLAKVRWSLAASCSAMRTPRYLFSAIAIATKLAASCAIVPRVAR